MTVDPGRRILVLIPHPDDEVVGAAALIGRACAGGAVVFGLYLTTGVPAREVLWPWQRAAHPSAVERRWREAAAAAQRLGLEIAGRSPRPTRTLRHHLAAAHAEIVAAIERAGADTLWTPAYEGAHADHDAANALASTLAQRVRVLEFAEYAFAGGRVTAQTFHDGHGGDMTIRLSADEQAQKRDLLALYASERRNLGHIGLVQESIRPLPAHDYRRPPHAGRLFYQRFHWVPFPHPRIDRTTPAELTADIAAFLRATTA